MTDDRRDIDTKGGDYDEVHNHGQYAKGDIYNNYQQAPTKLRDSSEAKLLAAVKNEVAGRLAQSLHNRVYIELNKEEDPSQVIQPWAVDVKLGSQPSQRCPEGTNIVDIFDKPEIGGKLLILGAPGSGKTMMLLQLAEELVRRAEKNASRPVPVLLNLSAWKPEFKDIPSWMVADLKLKYGVRQDIAKKWIEEGRILPLLDGLDELMSERQETCVGALNEFLPAWSGVPLVVCSRREEYQNYEANLGLNGAVILQPLTDGQIEKFLRGAGCEWLWEAVRQDADVMGEEGLARSPLLLTILVLASGGLPGALWQKEESAEERRRFLFEAYIAERLKRRYVGGKNLPATKHGQKPYRDDEKTKAWLGWLALRLIEENQTEFFIENLQPRFLATRWQKFVYGLLFGELFGGLWFLGLLFLFNGQFGQFGQLFGGLSLVLVFLVLLFLGLFGGLFGVDGSIETVETIKISWYFALTNFNKRNFYNSLEIGMFSGFFLGIVFGMVVAIAIYDLELHPIDMSFKSIQVSYPPPLYQISDPPLDLFKVMVWMLIGGLFGGLIGVLFGGLIGGLFGELVKSFTGAEVDTKTKDNQGIHQSIFNSVILGLMFIPFGMVIPITLNYFSESLVLDKILYQCAVFGFIFFMLSAINGGLSSAIKHYSLRLTLWLFGYSPLNYSKFLRYCTERGFLQRVGGGYRFVHALLRDHFAAQYTPK